MLFARHFTRHATASAQAEWSPTDIEKHFQWKAFQVEIKEGGRTILSGEVEAPSDWTQQAVTILAHKYLRKAGVPANTTPVEPTNRDSMPRWLWPRQPSLGAQLAQETSARQVFRRLAGHWTYAAFQANYFDDPSNPRPPILQAIENADGTTTVDRSPEIAWEQAREASAQAFYDECFYTLANQMAAPNSPQWFNTGLWWAYGLTGSQKPDQVGYISTHIGGKATQAQDVYSNPQTSACFILGLRDSLMGTSGILDNVTREARIFKYGSGSGANYSNLRAKGTPLSNGGTSSGLMSFLKLFDTNAGTIKSGGTTRRAARMVIIDTDHPEALDFAKWKAREEVKVHSMVRGAKAAKSSSPIATELLPGLQSMGFEDEPYATVSGQNANNSLRATDAFMKDVTGQRDAAGLPRDPATSRALTLWDTACQAAWECGDPGFQFHDTINRWHTIPKVGPQRATNPCSEYSFIDDSSCNLASLNLVKFWVGGHDEPVETARDGDLVPGASYFDVHAFEHTSKLWTTILDVSVGMSSFPDPRVAENSVNYRAVGLGYANLGGLMMLVGVPYDSESARSYAGLITAILHGSAWEQSISLAADPQLGPFHEFQEHREDVDRVLGLHRDAALKLSQSGAAANIGGAGAGHPFADSLGWVRRHWLGVDDIGTNAGELLPLRAGCYYPVRNAQLTLLAPTGTIGLVMGCDATGIEPVYMLTTFKKLAGGGFLQQEVGLLGDSLRGLGYEDSEAHDIVAYVRDHGKIGMATPHLRREHFAVFACANDISVTGHLGMMAAVQPFLSGAISKTVNLPKEATVGDVSSAYRLAWELGLKAVAIYRDGCKLSQPLSAVTAAPATNQQLAAPAVSSAAVASPTPAGYQLATPLSEAAAASKLTVPGLPPKGALTPRYKLPARRGGWTQKVTIAGYSVYLRTGEFPDGRLGEIFLTISRDGSTIAHMASGLAITMSLGLQHGVPLQEFVDAFTDSRAEPSGIVQNSDKVRMCSSIMDYVVRELAAHYLHLETAVPIVVQSPEPKATVPSITVTAGAQAQLEVILQTPVGERTAKPELNPVQDVLAEAAEPRVAGMRTLAAPKYNGNACFNCGSFTLRRSGTCHVCDTCGETSGCS